MIRRSISAGLALAVAVAFAGCGGGTSQAPTLGGSSEPSQATADVCVQAAADADFAGTVTAKNFAMTPTTVSIKAGETVAWTNDDAAIHTATLDNGACSTDNINPGTTAKLTFNVAGTYTYHCRIHAAMTGFTVEVTG